MEQTRREFMWAVTAGIAAGGVQIGAAQRPGGKMYGLIGKMTAVAGRRDDLANILIDGTAGMPGCLSYVVAADAAEPDALWVTEVWESQARHQGSLQLPAVQAAIAKGRPLIASFSNRVETAPIGGHGIVAAQKPELFSPVLSAVAAPNRSLVSVGSPTAQSAGRLRSRDRPAHTKARQGPGARRGCASRAERGATRDAVPPASR
jgi:quinol monooxygenase YgiN